MNGCRANLGVLDNELAEGEQLLHTDVADAGDGKDGWRHALAQLGLLGKGLEHGLHRLALELFAYCVVTGLDLLEVHAATGRLLLGLGQRLAPSYGFVGVALGQVDLHPARGWPAGLLLLRAALAASHRLVPEPRRGEEEKEKKKTEEEKKGRKRRKPRSRSDGVERPGLIRTAATRRAGGA